MQISEQGVLNSGDAGSPRAVTTFPTVLPLRDGTLLASYRVGSGKDTDDEAIELRRSSDGGRTWSVPAAPFSTTFEGRRGSFKVLYLSAMEGNRILGSTLWVDRQAHPGKPLFNDQTEGCLPMEVLLTESHDLGQTWTPWRNVPMPAEIGPPSLTSPVLKFPSGRLALSIETNKTYHDQSQWFQRVVYCYSDDNGKTWGSPQVSLQDPTARIFHWDQRAAVAPDGRLVTFTWTYDRQTTKYLNVHRRISRDEGRTWTAGEDLGFADQPSIPAIFPDGRTVVAWVDRFGSQSIRARMSQSIDAPLPAGSEVTLFSRQPAPQSNLANTGDLLAEMGFWTYGLPFAAALPDGDALVVYYAGTEKQMQARWARLKL